MFENDFCQPEKYVKILDTNLEQYASSSLCMIDYDDYDPYADELHYDDEIYDEDNEEDKKDDYLTGLDLYNDDCALGCPKKFSAKNVEFCWVISFFTKISLYHSSI